MIDKPLNFENLSADRVLSYLVRVFKIRVHLSASVVNKLAAPHEDDVRKRFHSKLNRQNLNGKSAEYRRNSKTSLQEEFYAKTGS